MIWGTSFAHPHAKWMGLDVHKTCTAVCEMGFESIRLGVYWNECEPQQGSFDFSAITSLLQIAQKKKQSVVVTVGMKAPRWPEFYIPSWTSQQDIHFEELLLAFIKETIQRLSSFSCITHWQIENEPLDPSGPSKHTVPIDLLTKEVATVREFDSSRPIVLTVWGNETVKRNTIATLHSHADVIGVDLYYKVPFLKWFFVGPRQSEEKLQATLQHTGKEYWITELQAEPWEEGNVFAEGFVSKTMNTSILIENIKQAKKIHPSRIYLWGAEYWYWKKEHGDGSLFETVKKVIQR